MDDLRHGDEKTLADCAQRFKNLQPFFGVTEPKGTDWGWWGGASEELYTERFDTEAEAEAHMRLCGGGYITEARKFDLPLCEQFEVSGWLEDVECHVYDDHGTDDGDPVFDLTTHQEAELQAVVRTAIHLWQTTNGLKFRGYKFTEQRNTRRVPGKDEK